VYSAAFSPDGKRIVTASRDNTARLWTPRPASPSAIRFKGHDNEVGERGVQPDGKRIVTASRDNTARLWDAETGKPIGNPLTHKGQCIVRRSAGRQTRRNSIGGRKGKTVVPGRPSRFGFELSEGQLISADYSPDGTRLVAVSQENLAEILNLLPEIESLQALPLEAGRPRVPTPALAGLVGSVRGRAERDYQACQNRPRSRASR